MKSGVAVLILLIKNFHRLKTSACIFLFENLDIEKHNFFELFEQVEHFRTRFHSFHSFISLDDLENSENRADRTTYHCLVSYIQNLQNFYQINFLNLHFSTLPTHHYHTSLPYVSQS